MVYVITTAFYGVMCSGDLQPWADPISEEDKSSDPLTRETIESKPSSQGTLGRSDSADSRSNSKGTSISSQGSKTR